MSKPETPKPGSQQQVVGWRVWHVERRRWCFDGQEWKTRKEAERAKVNATRGRRNTLTNFFRIAARIVPILADGTSPLRDDIQADWDSKMGKPANAAGER